jgi:hypothetical protein
VAFAIVDRDLQGYDAVVMVVDDRLFAERVTAELRRRRVRAAVVSHRPWEGPDWLSRGPVRR